MIGASRRPRGRRYSESSMAAKPSPLTATTRETRVVGVGLGRLSEGDQLGALREPPERTLLDLARPLGGDTELAAGLGERLRLLVTGAEAHLDHVALLIRQARDRVEQRLRAQLLVDLLVDRGGLERDEVAQRRVAILTDRLVERHDRAIRLADLDHVGQRQVGRRGDLLVARLVPKLRGQLALHAAPPAGPLRPLGGQAGGAAPGFSAAPG